jgi:predicted esterase
MMLGETQQDFFMLVVQCPPNNRDWMFQSDKDGNLDVVSAATDHVIANNPIDINRLSLFGLSNGGYGVWQWLLKYPKKFAAAVPTSSNLPNDFPKMAALSKTPIWTFANKNDIPMETESNRFAINIINDSGGFIKLTQFDQGGHAAWRAAMDECNCFSWMIAQKRGGWFNPPPEREVYTYRSTSDSLVAFFLPLLLTVLVVTFQRIWYYNRLRNKVKEKSYPVRENTANTTSDEANENKIEESNIEENKSDKTTVIQDQNFRTWTDTSGKKNELKLTAIKGDTVKFELLDGRKVKGKITMFCPEDQEIIKQYAAKNNAKNSNDFRTWTIPEKSKTFVAKFVNLQDNRVNLQTTTGHAAFIDIKLLSETDQEWIRSKLQDGE